MPRLKIALLGANSQLGFDLLRVGQKLHPDSHWLKISREDFDATALSSITPFLEKTDCDVIVNCMSYNKTDQAEIDPLSAFQINAFAVKEMAKVACKKDIPFFHISSDYVFSGLSDRPYNENDTPAPLSVYGSSKLLGEQLAIACCPKAIVLRTASLFGVAGSSGKGGNFIETVVRVLKDKQEMSVVNDIHMSPTGTYDLARMVLKMIALGALPGLYHAVNEGSATWYDFALEIQKKMELPGVIKPISHKDFPAKIRRPIFSVMDHNKIQSLVTDVPHWKEALDRYIKDKVNL